MKNKLKQFSSLDFEEKIKVNQDKLDQDIIDWLHKINDEFVDLLEYVEELEEENHKLSQE